MIADYERKIDFEIFPRLSVLENAFKKSFFFKLFNNDHEQFDNNSTVN